MELSLSNTGKPDTRVVVDTDALSELNSLAAGYTKTVLITDEKARQYCLEAVSPHLPEDTRTIVLKEGETTKSLERSKDILDQLQDFGCDRKSLIIGLGGGVVNDIAGFVASIYMRGIDWIMLPTTLTAQADASIGGKTGVNLGQYKNMVGSFWPSKAVLINPEFLKTLPDNHLRNGLAEIIKMGFIYDPHILEHVGKLDPADILGNELIKASGLAAKAKVEIVNKDMFESGERKLLNFGHTVGHAIEALALGSDSPLLHGEAISVGMVVESKLGELEGITEAGLSLKITELLRKFNLPTSYEANAEDILKIITSDKKNVAGNINWTLPKSAGQGIFNHVASPKNIKEAVKTVAADK